MSGNSLPLVVISHGVQGSLVSHYDSAIALAQAGFVVAALTHTGDNAQDQSYVGNRIDLTNRPLEMRRLVHYMLTEWPARDRIDPARIGIFGYSLGGFTALIAIGGEPDLG